MKLRRSNYKIFSTLALLLSVIFTLKRLIYLYYILITNQTCYVQKFINLSGNNYPVYWMY